MGFSNKNAWKNNPSDNYKKTDFTKPETQGNFCNLLSAGIYIIIQSSNPRGDAECYFISILCSKNI